MKALLLVAATVAITFFAVWGVASLATRITGVPRGFPPFTVLPLLSGVLGGFVGGWAVFALARLVSPQPARVFLFISLAILAASFALPLRLSFTRSARFAGVTPAAQMALTVLHSMIATAVVTLVTRLEMK